MVSILYPLQPCFVDPSNLYEGVGLLTARINRPYCAMSLERAPASFRPQTNWWGKVLETESAKVGKTHHLSQGNQVVGNTNRKVTI